MMSPCLPELKSWKKPFSSLTKKDGDFSLVKGERPANSRPLTLELHRPPDDVRGTQAAFQLVNETVVEAHRAL